MKLVCSGVVFVAFAIAGCSSNQPSNIEVAKPTPIGARPIPVGKAYPGLSLPLSEVAVISGGIDGTIHFKGIDNKRFGAFPPFKKFPKNISVMPCRDLVKVGYMYGSWVASGAVIIDAQPGKRYQITYSINGNKIIFGSEESQDDGRNYVQK